ncbi:hypothetical protein FB562_2185 [Homoserinimonas aerilata]|uniref:Uncharacterized protein n=1 Tax=Homoserinimonas aerilata TaxID=1162970 RepID=A0A542YF17_9MICO|nr:hypothetical protein [Homoserinimonas aerilata]TQL46661.1 hypothetical protein FB562_2185 [Homoserinimonas aerilata]
MRHTPQDAITTMERRQSVYPPSKWHPLLAAREVEPGLWYMIDSTEQCYGVIRIIRRGDEVGYRVTSWAQEASERQLIGYYRTLKGSCEAAHRRFVALHGWPGAVNSGRVPEAPARRL